MSKRKFVERIQRKAALEFWNQAKPAPFDQPYCIRNNIDPSGVRVSEEAGLLIPIYDTDNRLVDLQMISLKGDPNDPGEALLSDYMSLILDGQPSERWYAPKQ